jgi:uncharacterized delta-60 repeat protein
MMTAMPVLVRGHGARFTLLALALVLGAAILAPLARAATAGDLDPSFGTGGSERLFPNKETLFYGGIATQADDKIVMAGGDEKGNILLTRLEENGAPDPSFGSGGTATITLPTALAGADAVAIQADGTIVVAGFAELLVKSKVQETVLVARFLSNGQPDPSFGGGDGFTTVPIGEVRDFASAVAIGAGGRILVAGTTGLAAGEEAAVVVLRPDGELDPGFSADGIATVKTPQGDDRGGGIAEGPNGEVVLADESGAGGGQGFTIAKFLADGEPAPGFGTKGVAQLPIPGEKAGRSDSVAVLPDGRILAAGYGFEETSPAKLDSTVAAARLLPNGTPDPSFGAGNGFFSIQLAAGEESAQFMAPTTGGKVLLSGSYEASEDGASPYAIRLDAAGNLDPSFGSGGVVKRPALAPFGDYFEGAALDGKGRLVIHSHAFEGNETVSFELTRLLGDPPPASPSSPATVIPPPPAKNQPPHARIKKLGKTVDAAKLKGFFGTAADPEGEPLRRVQIALVRKVARKPKAHAAVAAAAKKGGRSCLDLRSAKGGFKLVHAKGGKPCPLLWLDATGTSSWSFKLAAALPVGSYVLYARAVDGKGLAETAFSAAAGNRAAFRVTAAAK